MNKVFLLLLLIPCSSFGQVTDNLLIHYPFDGNAEDVSGHGRDGIVNGAIFTEDRFGNAEGAAYFDGIDDYIEFPNIGLLKPDLPVSFSFWVRYDSSESTEQAVFNTSLEDDVSSGIFFNSSSSSGGYAINFGDGSPFYNSSSRRTFVSESTIELGSWVQIVIVLKSSTDMKIYADCVDEGGNYSGNGGDLFYSGTPGVLGRHDRDLNVPFEYFKGAVDDFRYWDRIVTPEEVKDLCQFLGNNDVAKKIDDIKVYPNPVKSMLNIETSLIINQLEFYDGVGRMLLSIPYSNTVDLGLLSPGMYYVRCVGPQLTKTKKFVVE